MPQNKSSWKGNRYSSKSLRKSIARRESERDRDAWVAPLGMSLLVLHCLSTLGLIYVVRQEYIPFLWYGIVLTAATTARLVGVVRIWKRKYWGFDAYLIGMVIVAILGSIAGGTWLFTLNEVLPLVVLGYLWRNQQTVMTK